MTLYSNGLPVLEEPDSAACCFAANAAKGLVGFAARARAAGAAGAAETGGTASTAKGSVLPNTSADVAVRTDCCADAGADAAGVGGAGGAGAAKGSPAKTDAAVAAAAAPELAGIGCDVEVAAPEKGSAPPNGSALLLLLPLPPSPTFTGVPNGFLDFETGGCDAGAGAAAGAAAAGGGGCGAAPKGSVAKTVAAVCPGCCCCCCCEGVVAVPSEDVKGSNGNADLAVPAVGGALAGAAPNGSLAKALEAVAVDVSPPPTLWLVPLTPPLPPPPPLP